MTDNMKFSNLLTLELAADPFLQFVSTFSPQVASMHAPPVTKPKVR